MEHPVFRQRGSLDTLARRPSPPGLLETCDLPTLLERMQKRDREAAAAFTRRYRGQIIRRIRNKLRLGDRMRRVVDSGDIISTLGRRLDALVDEGQLRAATERELWALVGTIVENALTDQQRAFRRHEAARSRDGSFLHEVGKRQLEAERTPRAKPDVDLEQIRRLLKDDIDLQIFDLWLKELPLFVIAEQLGLERGAVRQRWLIIRGLLREHLRPEGGG